MNLPVCNAFNEAGNRAFRIAEQVTMESHLLADFEVGTVRHGEPKSTV